MYVFVLQSYFGLGATSRKSMINQSKYFKNIVYTQFKESKKEVLI